MPNSTRGDFQDYVLRLWVKSPEAIVGRFGKQFDLSLSNEERLDLQDEIFFLVESLIDRWLFETLDPSTRQKMWNDIGGHGVVAYAKRNGRDIEAIRQKSNERREQWGKYPKIMTEDGPDGMLWHFSRHLTESVISDVKPMLFLAFMQWFGEVAKALYVALGAKASGETIGAVEWVMNV